MYVRDDQGPVRVCGPGTVCVMKNKRGEGKDGATISTSGALECTKSKSKLRGAPSLKTWCSKERRVARAALTSGSNTDARRVAAEQNAEVTGEPSRNRKKHAANLGAYLYIHRIFHCGESIDGGNSEE